MIKTLETIPLETIHDAFIDAFSEYEVPIVMPIDKLSEMLVTRSYESRFSLGFFDGDILAGFILIGFREKNGKKLFYDSATGVRKAYRGKGLGDSLLSEMMKSIDTRGIDAFVLEVLEHNKSAQSLYLKHGFTITRKLNCYELKGDMQTQKNPKARTAADTQLPDGISVSEYCTFEPSWQNSVESYRNVKDRCSVAVEKRGGEILGYGIVHRESGSILQLGLHPDHADTSVAETLVGRMREASIPSTLRYLNVEDGSAMEKTLLEAGFTNTINQYEMAFERS